MSVDHRDRRSFIRLIAAGSAAGIASTSAAADDPPKAAEVEPPNKSETSARMELILARFGKHLDDDAKKAVRAELEAIVRRSERLRKFALTNGDGPFPVFTPFRAPLGQ